jgi:hypothetical protein
VPARDRADKTPPGQIRSTQNNARSASAAGFAIAACAAQLPAGHEGGENFWFQSCQRCEASYLPVFALRRWATISESGPQPLTDPGAGRLHDRQDCGGDVGRLRWAVDLGQRDRRSREDLGSRVSWRQDRKVGAITKREGMRRGIELLLRLECRTGLGRRGVHVHRQSDVDVVIGGEPQAP